MRGSGERAVEGVRVLSAEYVERGYQGRAKGESKRVLMKQYYDNEANKMRQTPAHAELSSIDRSLYRMPKCSAIWDQVKKMAPAVCWSLVGGAVQSSVLSGRPSHGRCARIQALSN